MNGLLALVRSPRPSSNRRLKNRILLENDYLPGNRKICIMQFVNKYNTWRYPESMNNLTPEDVYHGRGQALLKIRGSGFAFFRPLQTYTKRLV